MLVFEEVNLRKNIVNGVKASPRSSFRAECNEVENHAVLSEAKSVFIDFSVPPPVKNRPAPVEMTIFLLALAMVGAIQISSIRDNSRHRSL